MTVTLLLYLPQGYILATYDSSGKLLRTAERFKDVSLPGGVRTAVASRFPNWTISNDVYKVPYEEASGAKMAYQLVLKNGSKRVKVKVDENGDFLN